MKRAIVDQMLLGFILVLGIITFVATLNDETKTRNYIYDLKAFAQNTAKTMARHYEYSIDMCAAQQVAKNLELQTKIGNKLISGGYLPYPNDNLGYGYTWLDKDSDGEPDAIQVKIKSHQYETFWYRFFDKFTFTIPDIVVEEVVNTPKDVSISYWKIPNAGYFNTMGTYQLDANNCVVNAQLHMANAKDAAKWLSNVGSGNGYYNQTSSDSTSWDNYNDVGDGSGDFAGSTIVSGITSPPTFVFLIANGNSHFNNPADDATVIFENQHCFGSPIYPRITINGITKQGVVGSEGNPNVFFEHTQLNADGVNHMHIIPKNVLSDYQSFKQTYNGNERDKYEAFLSECDTVNHDGNSSNNIPSDHVEDTDDGVNDCRVDPNGEYYYALEDLDEANSDLDFTDMLLDTTRTVIPNELNIYTVNALDQTIALTCNNTNPTVSLTCPASLQSGVSTNNIQWRAVDADGSINSASTSVYADQGSVALNGQNNDEGTITFTAADTGSTYTQTLTVSTSDNVGAAGQASCDILIDSDGTDDTGGGSGGTVPSDDENAQPVCEALPDMIVTEGDTVVVNVNCTDDDGNDLVYTLSSDVYSDSNNTGMFTIALPVGSSDQSPVTVGVAVNDGIGVDVIDSFIVTINPDVDTSFFHTFDTDDEGWNGKGSWVDDHGEGKLKITASRTRRNQETVFTFSFGKQNSHQDVVISFDMDYLGGWEKRGRRDRDYFKVKLNNSQVVDHSYSNGSNLVGSVKYTLINQTNINGDMEVKLIIKVTSKDEIAYIDNVRVAIQ